MLLKRMNRQIWNERTFFSMLVHEPKTAKGVRKVESSTSQNEIPSMPTN